MSCNKNELKRCRFYATFTLLQWRTRLTTIPMSTEESTKNPQFFAITFIQFLQLYDSQWFNNKIISQKARWLGARELAQLWRAIRRDPKWNAEFLTFYFLRGEFFWFSANFSLSPARATDCGRLSTERLVNTSAGGFIAWWCSHSASISNLDSPHRVQPASM